MEILLQSVLALLMLIVVFYAHARVPAFSRGSANVAITRVVLILVGFGFGLTAANYASHRIAALVAFVIGFGLVHTPAAIILFLKGRRGEGKS